MPCFCVLPVLHCMQAHASTCWATGSQETKHLAGSAAEGGTQHDGGADDAADGDDGGNDEHPLANSAPEQGDRPGSRLFDVHGACHNRRQECKT